MHCSPRWICDLIARTPPTPRRRYCSSRIHQSIRQFRTDYTHCFCGTRTEQHPFLALIVRTCARFVSIAAKTKRPKGSERRAVAMMNPRWAVTLLVLLLGCGCWPVATRAQEPEELFLLPTEGTESVTEWVTTTDLPPVSSTTTVLPVSSTSTLAPTATSTATSKSSAVPKQEAGAVTDFRARILLTSPDGQETDLTVSSVVPSVSTTVLDNSLRTTNNDWTPIVRPSTRLPSEASVTPSSPSSPQPSSSSSTLLIRPTPLLRPLPTIVAAPGRVRPSSSTPSTTTISGTSTTQQQQPSISPPPPLIVHFDIADAGLQPPVEPSLFPDDAVFFPPQFVDDLNGTESVVDINQEISNASSSTATTTSTTPKAVLLVDLEKNATSPTLLNATLPVDVIPKNDSLVEVEEDRSVSVSPSSGQGVTLAGGSTSLLNRSSDITPLQAAEGTFMEELPTATEQMETEDSQTTDAMLTENATFMTEPPVTATSPQAANVSSNATIPQNETTPTTAAPPTSIPSSVVTEQTTGPSTPASSTTDEDAIGTGRTTTLSALSGLPTLFPALTRQPSTTSTITKASVTTIRTPTTPAIPLQTTPHATTPSVQHESSFRPSPTPDFVDVDPHLTSIIHQQDTQASIFPHDPSITTEPFPISDWSSPEGSAPSTQDPNTTTIVAISVSVSLILCVALLLLLLIVLRRRRARAVQGTCQPARMDAYSLDNVSQSGSNTWQRGKVRSTLRASKRSYLNQAFDDSAAFSVPLTAAQLALYMEKPITSIEAEFRNVATTSTVRLEELPAGVESKNRYANVLPIPETRVHIRVGDGQPVDSVEQYINANYIKGPKEEPRYYIGCQGPMDETVEDFWQMIWENQVRTIVQLTDLSENGVARCAEYLPPSEVLDCHRLYGDYQVTLKSRELRDNYVTSHVQLKRMEDNLVREITHLWYSSWPATGVPEDPKTVVALLLEARKGQSKDQGQPAPPIVVHCSPGTGRTGAVLAIDVCLRQLDASRSIDIPRCVHRLRQDRAGCVQTGEQYAFIYKAVNFYASQLSNGALDSL